MRKLEHYLSNYSNSNILLGANEQTFKKWKCKKVW
jgi:hypothetical protein